ncbi:hypothetical protein NA57DRAFT_79373 [Rhizodiscina lignyota]|uniref:DUF829-domain-containing protein n=1 Tax=Rhizodiscina lignyota TaxID=1504668 RepID=A0A9P4IB32_9PEZI|nr:hypothetical protein NA57DRAFT_79373 [Rhizodiscina lignyota]
MAPSNPFPTFAPLNSARTTYLYNPPKTNGIHPSNSVSPDLVILCAWLGALPKHILKYTSAYQSSYPSTTILLLTSHVNDFVFIPDFVQRQRLTPAAEFVRSFRKSHEQGRILLHAFSNGGGRQATQLAQAYKAATAGEVMPVDAMALDSCPGRGSFKDGTRVFLIGTPRSLMWIARPIVYFIMGMLWIWSVVFGQKNVVDRVREGLNDQGLFPKVAPRLYVYSKTDTAVLYQDVEEHAEEARKKGWSVEKVRVDGSLHVAHMMKDPDAYWGAIRGVLQRADEITQLLK